MLRESCTCLTTTHERQIIEVGKRNENLKKIVIVFFVKLRIFVLFTYFDYLPLACSCQTRATFMLELL